MSWMFSINESAFRFLLGKLTERVTDIVLVFNIKGTIEGEHGNAAPVGYN